MRTIEQLDAEIAERRRQLETVTGTPTEIYSRIVGYYRSLKNWNSGKREEFRARTTYDVAASLTGLDGRPEPRSPLAVEDPATTAPSGPIGTGTMTARYYYSTTCPRCIAMKRALDGRVPTEELNVEEPAGFARAAEDGITMTPTVILLDPAGTEVVRSSDPATVAGWVLVATEMGA